VGDGMGIDHKQSRAEGQVANGDAPEWQRRERFAQTPVALARPFSRVVGCEAGSSLIQHRRVEKPKNGPELAQESIIQTGAV